MIVINSTDPFVSKILTGNGIGTCGYADEIICLEDEIHVIGTFVVIPAWLYFEPPPAWQRNKEENNGSPVPRT